MWGSIIGDIAGSIYEYNEFTEMQKGMSPNYQRRITILDKNNPLLNAKGEFTDDTIFTAAIANSIISKCDYKEKLIEYGRYYLDVGKTNQGFGCVFLPSMVKWIENNDEERNSNGNGSAMRVAPIGLYYNNEEDVLEQAKLSSIPTHNSKQAINGAQAIALAVFLAKQKMEKNKIKEEIEKRFNYSLDYSLEDLQKKYTYKMNCEDCVPEAIYIFLQANDFEDGIRKAISIGGDTDTIACMVGGILEAYYGVPEALMIIAQTHLDEKIKKIIDEFYICDNMSSL
jgi:ADP-ribosylglycohydrolase